MNSDSSSDLNIEIESESDDELYAMSSLSISAELPVEEIGVNKIEYIVGVKLVPGIDESISSISAIPRDKLQYFVKWVDKSHIHNSFLSENDIFEVVNGERVLKKFMKRSQGGISRNKSKPDILTAYQDDYNESWTQVDRLLGVAPDGKWLVKWCGIDYGESTWESPEEIPYFEGYLSVYKNRRKRSNPKNISSRKPRPTEGFVPLEVSPICADGSMLRDYQLGGVNWLLNSWFDHRNNILADEMGLGKTIQTVVTLAEITHTTKITGPFLVITPLSTLQSWKNEFEKWSDLNAVVFHGNAKSRDVIMNFEFPAENNSEKLGFDVLITNYETFSMEFETFKKIHWRYLVLDEGHRLKNHEGKCYKLLNKLKYEHCTILTGTPIQNNIEELWSLLHLLHPKEFNDLPNFLERFGNIDDYCARKELQDIIMPYILRRKKCDVEKTLSTLKETTIEVELSHIQKMYYKALLQDNSSVLMHKITNGSLQSLQNLIAKLRNVCNHPFLIKGATGYIHDMIREKLGESASEEDVLLHATIYSSGKMFFLDKLLPKLHQDGHKVLIFSHMVKILDIIEDYLELKNIQYERIDGNVPEPERNAAIERFSNNIEPYIFLLCTRAGGFGINLTAADTVIIFDSDWNPQNDIQAQSRCHRIGQFRDVRVYKLVTRGTYEKEMIEKASNKLALEQALLDDCEMNTSPPVHAFEIENLLRHGAYNIFLEDDTETDNFYSQDIDQILDSRSIDLPNDDFSSSLMPTTSFDNESYEKEIVSDDFWTKILPKDDEIDAILLESKDSKKPKPSYVETFSDSDSDLILTKSYRKRTYSPIKEAKRILIYGINKSDYDRALLYYAAANSTTLTENDTINICEILKIPSLSKPTDGIISSLNYLTSRLQNVLDRGSTIIMRCIFFHKLKKIMAKLQGNVPRWPNDIPSDPTYDYAFLLGVFRNGLDLTKSLTRGIDYRDIRITSMIVIDKQLSYLITQLEEILKDEPTPVLGKKPNKSSYDLVRPDYRGDEMEPKEWEIAHPNIFNRKEITKEETLSLFLTMYSFGVTKDEEGNYEWDKISDYANARGVALETVKEVGETILELGDLATKSEGFEEALAKTDYKFEQYGTKVWFKKMHKAVNRLGEIRDFVKSITSKEKELISRMKPLEVVDWWTSEEDLALLECISEYGNLFTSTWVVRKDKPFRKRIPQELLKDYEEAAATEIETKKWCMPRTCGPLAFLFREKIRLARAITIMKAVESFKEEEALEYARLELIPNKLLAISFGELPTADSKYPINYIAKVLFNSVNDPSKEVWYEESTCMDDHNNIRFIVKMTSDELPTFCRSSPDECWEQIYAKIREKGGKVEELSGETMFGFDNPKIVDFLGDARIKKEHEKQQNAKKELEKIVSEKVKQFRKGGSGIPIVKIPKQLFESLPPEMQETFHYLSRKQLPKIQQIIANFNSQKKQEKEESQKPDQEIQPPDLSA